jgi:phosphatidylethanolamine/phosphatidyl-N-methylethanolamine N-methyltransferase
MAEVSLFFRQLFSKPKQVSAIAPSSRWLAREMARNLGPHTGRVVEFGPGTGVLTRGILAAGVAAKDLTLFEMNPVFVGYMRENFPGVTVHQAGAQTAADLVAVGVGAVISGLPLLSMPLDLREAIVKAAFDILAPGGVYIQFTYGSKPALSPEQLARMGLVVDSGVRVWANMPPANVFRFRRAG